MSTLLDHCYGSFRRRVDDSLMPKGVEHSHVVATEIEILVDVSHLPALTNTWELAEPVPSGPSVQKLIELARRFQIFVSAGMSEKDDDIVTTSSRK